MLYKLHNRGYNRSNRNSKDNKKAQASLEFIIIAAVSLVILIAIIHLSQDSISSYDKVLIQSKTKSFLNEVTSAAELIYQQGTGAKTQLYINVPSNIKDISIDSRVITVEFLGGDKHYRNLGFDAVGDIPSEEGNYWIDIEAVSGLVVISTNSSAVSLNYSYCGNNEKEFGEECDGIDLGGKSCATFGYLYGPLECDNCKFDTSNCYNRDTEICDDGVDNDDNDLVDCLDPQCVGSIGPLGGFCCVGLDSNCPGVDQCKSCGEDNECDFNGTADMCSEEIACSNPGDNGYSMRGPVPSQGYCDGFGNCDYALPSPFCNSSPSVPQEASDTTICIDGTASCSDSCANSVDDDLNGCIDNVDYKCGGFETSCNDEADNDCDGLVDCLDTDCNGFIASGELPNNGFNEIVQWNWPEGANMEKNTLLLHMNELTGTVLDTSGFSNSCVPSGGISYGRDGMFNSALGFDAYNDYLSCGKTASLMCTKAITVSVWVNHSSSDSYGYIVNFGGDSRNYGYALSWYKGYVRVELQKSREKRTCTNTAPSNNAWHNIVFTWDYSSRIIYTYIDGVRAPTTCVFRGPIGTPSVNLNIGRSQRSGMYYGGVIDEVAIWNRTLSAIEIMNNYLRKDYCLTHDCTFTCGVENCTNMIDDNGNYLIDCADRTCIGIEGPDGSICCAGDAENCPGADVCKECKANNECGMLPTSTICATAYECSIAGDDGYAMGGKVPSQGYCDGNGTCDLALTVPVCTLNDTASSELSGATACVPGNTSCVDTCSDMLDNDEDGCIDIIDSDCGGVESSCVNGIDDDCDGIADCADYDCLDDQACVHQETDCANGADDDYDSLTDCADNDCIGALGPSGGTCCAGNPGNCPGQTGCKSCAANNECSYMSTTTLCNLDYYCSNAGDNGYNLGGRVPSQGYCDGYGYCDYAASSPLCTIVEGGSSEGSTVTACVSGQISCRNTCTDSIDNDGDGCMDSVDSGCGGTESSCNDGVDNDCDSLVDCYDPDCSTYTGCMDCRDRATCSACLFDGKCTWCSKGFCTDVCKTGFLQNCRGGICYKTKCP